MVTKGGKDKDSNTLFNQQIFIGHFYAKGYVKTWRLPVKDKVNDWMQALASAFFPNPSEITVTQIYVLKT